MPLRRAHPQYDLRQPAQPKESMQLSARIMRPHPTHFDPNRRYAELATQLTHQRRRPILHMPQRSGLERALQIRQPPLRLRAGCEPLETGNRIGLQIAALRAQGEFVEEGRQPPRRFSRWSRNFCFLVDGTSSLDAILLSLDGLMGQRRCLRAHPVFPYRPQQSRKEKEKRQDGTPVAERKPSDRRAILTPHRRSRWSQDEERPPRPPRLLPSPRWHRLESVIL